MHNGLLNVDNEKMSKSLGNFFTIRDVLKRYDGETLRFFMLRTHYRSPFNFSDANLDDARSALRRLYTALDGVVVAATPVDWAQPQAAAFRAAMNDDFNTPVAVAVLFELANELNRTRSASLGRAAEGPGRDARPAAAGAAQPICRRATRWTRPASPSASPRAPPPSRRATSRSPTRSARTCSRKASCCRTRRPAPPG